MFRALPTSAGEHKRSKGHRENCWAGRRRRPGPWKRTVVSTHLSKMLTDRAVAETDEPILHVTMVLGNRIKCEKQRRAGREART